MTGPISRDYNIEHVRKGSDASFLTNLSSEDRETLKGIVQKALKEEIAKTHFLDKLHGQAHEKQGAIQRIITDIRRDEFSFKLNRDRIVFIGREEQVELAEQELLALENRKDPGGRPVTEALNIRVLNIVNEEWQKHCNKFNELAGSSPRSLSSRNVENVSNQTITDPQISERLHQLEEHVGSLLRRTSQSSSRTVSPMVSETETILDVLRDLRSDVSQLKRDGVTSLRDFEVGLEARFENLERSLHALSLQNPIETLARYEETLREKQADLEETQERLQNASDELEDLHAEYARLREEFETQSQDLTLKDSLVPDLENIITRLEEEKLSLEQKIYASSMESETLEESLRERTSEISRLAASHQDIYARLQEELSQTRQKLLAQEEHIHEFLERVDEANASERRKLHGDLAASEERLTEALHAQESLRTQLSNTTEEITGLRKAITDLEQSLQQSEEALSNAQHDKRSLTLEKETLSSQLEKAQARYKTVVTFLKNLSRQLIEENENLKSLIRDRDQTLSDLGKRAQELEGQLEINAQTIETVKQEKTASSQASAQQVNSLEQERDSLSRELDAVKAAIQEQAGDFAGKEASLKSQIDSLKNQIDLQDTNLKSLERENTRLLEAVALSERTLQEKDAQLLTLQTDIDRITQELRASQEARAALTRTLEQSAADLRAKTQETEALRDQILTLQETAHVLVEQLDLSRIENQDLKHAAEALQEGKRQLEERIRTLDQSAADKQKEIERLTRVIEIETAGLNGQIDGLRNQNSNLQRERLSLMHSLEEATSDKERIIREHEISSNQLKARIQDLKQRLTSSQRNVQQRQHDLATLQQRFESQESIVEELSEERARLNQEIQQSQRSLTESEATLRDLQTQSRLEIASLQRQLGETNSALETARREKDQIASDYQNRIAALDESLRERENSIASLSRQNAALYNALGEKEAALMSLRIAYRAQVEAFNRELESRDRKHNELLSTLQNTSARLENGLEEKVLLQEENTQLTERLAQSETALLEERRQSAELRASIGSLRGTIEEQQVIIESQKSTNNRLFASLRECLGELSALEDRYTALEKTQSDTAESLEAKRQLAQQLQQQLAITNATLENTQRSLRGQRSLNEGLQKQVEQLNAIQRELSSAKEENSRLLETIRENEASLQLAESQRQDLISKMQSNAQQHERLQGSLRSELKQRDEELSSLQSSLSSIRDQLASESSIKNKLQETLESLRTDKGSLQEALQKATTTLSSTQNRLDSEISRVEFLEKSLQRLTETSEKDAVTLREREDAIRSLREQQKQNSLEIEKFKSLASQREIALDIASEKITHLAVEQARLELALQASMRQLETALQVSKEGENLLRQQLDEQKNRFLEELSLLKNQLASKEKELEVKLKLEEQIASLEKRVQSLSSENDSIPDLRFSLDTTSQELRIARQELEASEGKNEELSLEMERLQGQLLSEQMSLRILQQSYQDLASQRDDLQSQLDEERTTSPRAISTLQGELSATKGKLTQLNLTNETLKRQIDDLQGELAQSILRHSNAEEILRSDLNRLLGENRSLKAELEKNNTSYLSLQEELTDKIRQHHRDLANAEKKFKTAQEAWDTEKASLEEALREEKVKSSRINDQRSRLALTLMYTNQSIRHLLGNAEKGLRAYLSSNAAISSEDQEKITAFLKRLSSFPESLSPGYNEVLHEGHDPLEEVKLLGEIGEFISSSQIESGEAVSGLMHCIIDMSEKLDAPLKEIKSLFSSEELERFGLSEDRDPVDEVMSKIAILDSGIHKLKEQHRISLEALHREYKEKLEDISKEKDLALKTLEQARINISEKSLNIEALRKELDTTSQEKESLLSQLQDKQELVAQKADLEGQIRTLTSRLQDQNTMSDEISTLQVQIKGLKEQLGSLEVLEKENTSLKEKITKHSRQESLLKTQLSEALENLSKLNEAELRVQNLLTENETLAEIVDSLKTRLSGTEYLHEMSKLKQEQAEETLQNLLKGLKNLLCTPRTQEVYNRCIKTPSSENVAELVSSVSARVFAQAAMQTTPPETSEIAVETEAPAVAEADTSMAEAEAEFTRTVQELGNALSNTEVKALINEVISGEQQRTILANFTFLTAIENISIDPHTEEISIEFTKDKAIRERINPFLIQEYGLRIDRAGNLVRAQVADIISPESIGTRKLTAIEHQKYKDEVIKRGEVSFRKNLLESTLISPLKAELAHLHKYKAGLTPVPSTHFHNWPSQLRGMFQLSGKALKTIRESLSANLRVLTSPSTDAHARKLAQRDFKSNLKKFTDNFMSRYPAIVPSILAYRKLLDMEMPQILDTPSPSFTAEGPRDLTRTPERKQRHSRIVDRLLSENPILKQEKFPQKVDQVYNSCLNSFTALFEVFFEIKSQPESGDSGSSSQSQ